MGDRERIERFEEAAKRCLQARDGKDLDTQLALTRAAVRYDRAARTARRAAALAFTLSQTGEKGRA